MLNRTLCITDEMPHMWPLQMVRSLCTILGLIQNVLNNVADFIPHCAKFVHIVLPCDKDVVLFNVLCIPPASPIQTQGYLPMVINWTPTTELIPCQVQPGPAHKSWSPLSRQMPQEKYHTKVVQEVYSTKIHVCEYPLQQIEGTTSCCKIVLK